MVGLQWLLVTLIGFFVSLFWIEIGERPDVGVLQGMIGGVMIGLAQLLVLRRYISKTRLWVLASCLSWGLMGLTPLGAMGWIAPKTLYIPLRFVYGVIDGTQIGFWVGIGQWLVLKQHIPNAERWIMANILCWSIALAMGWTMGGILRLLTGLFLSEVIGLTFTWLLVGGMTGVSLMKLIQTQGLIKKT